MARIVDTTLTMPWMENETVQIHPITKIENVIGLSEVVVDVGNNSLSTKSNTIVNDSQQSEINGLLEALAGSGLVSRDTRNVTKISTSSGDGELPYLYPVTFLESSNIEAISSGANNNTLLVSEEINGYTITGYNTVKRSPGLPASITMRLYADGILIDSLIIVPSKDGEYPVSKHVIHVIPEGASPQLLSVTYECTTGSIDIISGELKVTSNFVAGGAELSNNTDLVTLTNPSTATPAGDKTNVTEALAEITTDLGNALSSNSPLDATKLFNTVSKDRLPVASSTADGIITVGTQSIKGAKTFYDNAIFNGTIQVLGKTITNEVEVVSTSNGIIFEGTVVDDFEGILKADALSADRIYTLPNKTGTLAMISDITPVTNISVVENATTVSINSSTGSDDHIEGATHTKAGVVTNGTQTFGGYKSILNGMTAGTTEAFTSPHLALKATNNVDTVGFVGITFATSTVANYGYSLGSQRTGGGNGEFIIRHHVNNALGSEVLRIGVTGDITGHKFIGPLAGNSSTATKLVTPRAIKLTGDVTDITANFDGSSDIELSLSVKNDSHTHDTRYYTKAESNSRYTIKPGDHTTNNTEYSPVWENNGGVLYTSTANLKYNPGLKTLTSNIFKGSLTGNANTATKLATARTISLGNDLSGSATFDGSSNITINATVGNNSHTHTIANVTDLQTNLNLKAPIANPTFTGLVTTTGIQGTAADLNNRPSIEFNDSRQIFYNSDSNWFAGSINTSGGIIADGGGSFGYSRLTDVGSPTEANDATNKAYVDGVAGGLLSATSSLDATKLINTISDARLPATISSNITGNAATATKLANIPTTFNSEYPMLVNVGGKLYSHPTVKYSGANQTLTAPKFAGALVGNASTATKLATARTISLGNDLSGSATFDGSSNITINATVGNNSHTHTIANVTSLQTTLDAKLLKANPTFTGTLSGNSMKVTDIRTNNGAELTISAGELNLTAKGGEIVHIGGESGVIVYASTDNAVSGANKSSTLINSSGNAIFGGTVSATSFTGTVASSNLSGTISGALLPSATSNVTGGIKMRVSGTILYMTNNGNAA